MYISHLQYIFALITCAIVSFFWIGFDENDDAGVIALMTCILLFDTITIIIQIVDNIIYPNPVIQFFACIVVGGTNLYAILTSFHGNPQHTENQITVQQVYMIWCIIEICICALSGFILFILFGRHYTPIYVEVV